MGRTYPDGVNVPKRKAACVAIDEVAQVLRVQLQFFERRAIEKAKGLKCNVGQHNDKNSVVLKERDSKLRLKPIEIQSLL